jgi:hypothetical protein
MKIRKCSIIPPLVISRFSHPIIGGPCPLTLRVILDQFLERGDGIFVSQLPSISMNIGERVLKLVEI